MIYDRPLVVFSEVTEKKEH